MYASAMILGFLGSLHCVVMCGPISMAMSGQSTLNKFIASRVIYNLGRVVTYSLIGLIFGILGELIGLAGYQQAFSIVLGILMIGLALTFSGPRMLGKLTGPVTKTTNNLKKWLSKWLKNPSMKSSFILGFLNGFLPCGLVYAGIAGALATADLLDSVFYMAGFGMGTFPAMLLMALSGQFLNKLPGFNPSKISAVFVVVLGLLLVVRGLNLDIPYLSPAISYLYPSKGITICN